MRWARFRIELFLQHFRENDFPFACWKVRDCDESVCCPRGARWRRGASAPHALRLFGDAMNDLVDRILTAYQLTRVQDGELVADSRRRETHQRSLKFSYFTRKRLLQQYRHETDMSPQSPYVRYREISGPWSDAPRGPLLTHLRHWPRPTTRALEARTVSGSDALFRAVTVCSIGKIGSLGTL